MATQVQWRGGSTAEHSTFTGAAREVTVDTQKKTLVVHDGSTAGGEPLLREDQVNLPTSVTNGLSVPSTNNVAISTNGTGRLFIDASGAIITSSTAWLGEAAYQANGLQIGGATYAKAVLQTGGTSRAEWFFDSADNYLLAKSGSFYIFNTTANPITFGTNNTERMRLDSSGRLGLGTSSAQGKFESAAGDSTDYAIVANNSYSTGDQNYIRFNALTTAIGSINRVTNDIAIKANYAGVSFWTGTGGTATQKAVIDSSGRLGIGTTSPSESLDVNGNIRMSAVPGTNTNAALAVLFQTSAGTIDGGSSLTFNPGSDVLTVSGLAISSNTVSGSGSIGTLTCANGAGQYDFRATNDSLRFISGASEAARFDGSQRLLVGTSAATGNNKLQVVGSDASINGVTVGKGSGSGTENAALGHQALLAGTTGAYNTALGAGALYACTTGSGNIGLGGWTSGGSFIPVFNVVTENNRVVMGSSAVTNAYVQVAWTVVSDARDKINFAPVPHGLDFVNQLKPTAFQFKVDRNTEKAQGPVRYGFKAQDILELEGDTGVIIDNEDPEKLRYNGEALVPVLVNAIQELTSVVKKLEAKVAALEAA